MANGPLIVLTMWSITGILFLFCTDNKFLQHIQLADSCQLALVVLTVDQEGYIPT